MARPGNTFDEFLGERGNIVKEIQEFLNVVLLYCVDQEEKYEAKPNEIISPEHARSLITSFCTIHSLYGYPRDIGENKDEEGESRKSEKRKWLILTWQRWYCPKSSNKKYWPNFNQTKSIIWSNEKACIFFIACRPNICDLHAPLIKRL